MDTISRDDKLTNWKNEPSISDLQKDFDSISGTQREHISKVAEWSDQYFVRGKAKPVKRKGHSSVQPKTIRKQAEWRSAALSEPFLSTDDIYMVEPRTWEDREAAYQNGMLLNFQYNNKLNKVNLIDSLVRKLCREGTAIAKASWIYSYKEIQTEVPVYEYHDLRDDLEFTEFISKAIELKESNPNMFNDLPDTVKASVEMTLEQGFAVRAIETGEMEKVTETKVLQNQPYVEVLNIENVYIDPSCQGDMDKATFVIHRFETSIAELKKSGNYKNLDKLTVKDSDELIPSISDDEIKTSTPTDYNISGKSRKRFNVTEYWGYYDIDDSGVLTPIVVAYVGDVKIRCSENPYPHGKPPFVVIPYLPMDSSVYGEPDAELIYDNQAIIGASTRAMIDLVARSANGQNIIRKDVFDPVNYRKFMAGEDAQSNPLNVPLAEAIRTVTTPEVPSIIPGLIQQQNNEAESLSGVKAFSEGISSGSLGDVAAGIRGVLDASSKREMSILRRLKKGMVDLGRMIIAMNQEFLTDEEIIRITNDAFVHVKREALAGDFDLKVDISTPEAEQQKSNQLAFLVQTIGNTIPFEITKVLLTEISRLNKMPDVAQMIKEFEPTPDPLEEQKKQLELAKLQQEIKESAAREAYYLQRGSLATSQKDKTDLDFIEQESGVKQAREKELRAEQSKAQAKTKVLDALLKSKFANGNSANNSFKPISVEDTSNG